MALAERLLSDTSIFLENTRNWVNREEMKKGKKSTKPWDWKWAAVNDGDDNSDEEDVNIIWMMEGFWRSNEANKAELQTFLFKIVTSKREDFDFFRGHRVFN